MDKKIWVIVLLLIFCSALFASDIFAQAKSGSSQKIVLKKYPGFKLGFLANNFYKALPLSKDNLKKIFDWASQNGFWWVEIRDTNGDLTYVFFSSFIS